MRKTGSLICKGLLLTADCFSQLKQVTYLIWLKHNLKMHVLSSPDKDTCIFCYSAFLLLCFFAAFFLFLSLFFLLLLFQELL